MLLKKSVDEKNNNKPRRSCVIRNNQFYRRIGSRVNATKNAHTVLHGAEEFDGNVKWNMLA